MSPERVYDWIQTQLFEQVPVSISVINRDFKIVDANQRFTEQYGEWRSQPCHRVYKDREERCEQCGAAKTFSDGQVRVREEQGVTLNGSQNYYLVHIVPIVGPEGDIPFIVEMSTDITETKKLQQGKIEAERLAAVGQTVAGLAHGIKNIIMGLEGGMYVVNSGLRNNNEERIISGWKMLEEDIKRISAFAKEFLDFAKGRTPKVNMVNPNRVAGQVVALFRKTAALAGVTLEADLDKTVMPAALDEEAIHTCLANLVSNAIDACEMSNNAGLRVTVSTKDEDGVLVYAVRDNGCGMDYDIKQRVFTNFFSTKGSGKGTGLGLLTTRKIIHEHGGRVAFESTEGIGSVFRLEMPRERLPKPSEETSE